MPMGAVGFIGFARRDTPSRSDSKSITDRAPELVRLPTSYRSTKNGDDRLSRRKDSGSEEKVRVGGGHFLFFTLSTVGAWHGQARRPFFFIDDEIEDLLGLNLEESSDREAIELQDTDRLSIATLGALKQHPRISRFREFIEDWYLSYFTPDAARDLPRAGPQKHLNMHGDNLGNVVQFMEREHPRRFRAILSSIAEKIPGIRHIDTERTADGRLLLRFNDRGFTDPFYAQQMSDGTLKVFAYLLLLEDPSPPPFLCIEEPENGLYHKLLDTLASEFRSHATGRSGGSQIFVTTHQPYFVDALDPDEVWLLEKGEDGFARVRRASDSSLTTNLVGEGLPLGGLWSSDYLDGEK